MRCIDPRLIGRPWRRPPQPLRLVALAGALAGALGACSTPLPGPRPTPVTATATSPAPVAAPAPAPASAPAAGPGPAGHRGGPAAGAPPAAPAPTAAAAPRPALAPPPPAEPKAVPLAARRTVTLPAPPPARNWDDFKVQAARRLVAAHPDGSYMGKPPEPLLAIPVLEVELHADGSVRRVVVVREPREAKDTARMAIDAVRRAAPYGDVSRLSRPWKFVVVFLYDDERRFKPAELDR